MIIGFVTATDVTHERFVQCEARPAGPDRDGDAALERVKGGVCPVERRLVLLNTQGTRQFYRHNTHRVYTDTRRQYTIRSQYFY